MRQLVLSLRPKQWSKNVLVFAGLFFAKDIFNPDKIKAALMAFVCFCLMSSAGYVINDIMDREKDALHPRKKNRPIAAGARICLLWLECLPLLLSSSAEYPVFILSTSFGLILLLYLIFSVSLFDLYEKNNNYRCDYYSIGFHVPGYRRNAGHKRADFFLVDPLYDIPHTFFSTYKRRAEAMALGENASAVRTTLGLYSPQFLDHMINTVTAACLMAYALYTLDPATVAKFHSRNLVFTVPFVIYGLFRYLFLVYHQNMGEAVDTAIMQDKPILICILSYALTVIAIIYL